MAIKSVAVNGVVTQTAVNTLKYEQILVPGSQNAKAVVIEDIELDVQEPDMVASTQTASMAMVVAGKKAPTSLLLSTEGAVHLVRDMMVCDATPLPTVYEGANPKDREGPFPVSKEQDGSFYVTVAIQTAACTALKNCYYRIDFTVEDS